MNGFDFYKDKCLKFLNEEIAQGKSSLSELKEQGQKDEYIEAYLAMLENIIKYVEKTTKTGIFVGVGYDEINRDLMTLSNKGDHFLGSNEWRQYMHFFMNGKTNKYDIKPTAKGQAVWNRKRYQNIRDEEIEKCSFIYHKLRVLVEEFNLEKFPKRDNEKPKKNVPFLRLIES